MAEEEVLDWDCGDEMIDEDFLIDDDDVDVEDEEEYEYIEDDDFDEFTDEDFEEEEEEEVQQEGIAFPRFTQNVAPKRGVGGIIRDPNAPVPEPMKDSPIPFNGWDHSLTLDTEDAAAKLDFSNTNTPENYPSTNEDLLMANATESATVQNPSEDVQNGGENDMKKENDSGDGEENHLGVEDPSENSADTEPKENNTVQDPNEDSAVQDPNKSNADPAPEENSISEDMEASHADSENADPDENTPVIQDPNKNGTTQDPDKNSTAQDTSEKTATGNGVIQKANQDKAQNSRNHKLAALLYAVFIAVCAVWWFACVASPPPSNPKWGFSMLRRMDLSGQTAIVTGANRGIGFWITRFLAEQGAEVIMGCRSQADCDLAAAQIRVACEPHEARLDPLQLDLASFKSVRMFAQHVMDKHRGGALDMMFLNAGIGSTDGQTALSEDGIERVFATNFVGHYLLHSLLAALLLDAKPIARVVAVTDVAHYQSYDYGVATDLETLNAGARESLYAQSKLAQILWVQELTRLHGPNSTVYINSCHPGQAGTDIIFGSGWRNDFRRRLPGLLRRQTFGSPQHSALTPLYLGAHTKELVAKNVRGRYFHPIAFEHTPHNHTHNLTLQQEMWAFANELIRDFNFLD